MAVLQHAAVLNALKNVSQKCDVAFADEACAGRYLRAKSGNVDLAAAALASTIRWRAATKPASHECSDCQKNPHSHNMRIVGLDLLGRPVIYSCFSQSQHRFDPETNMEHFTRVMEDACSMLDRRSSSLLSEQVVWIADFHGYSMLKDSSPRTGVLTARLLAHYPERLGRGVILDAPPFFERTWTVLKRMLNEVTVSKVCFARRNNGTLEEELGRWAGNPLRTWLLAEIDDNRLPVCQNGRKEYWVKPRSGGHDARGAPDFVCSAEFALTYSGRLQALLQDDTHGDENATPAQAISILAGQWDKTALPTVAAAFAGVLTVFIVRCVPHSVATAPVILASALSWLSVRSALRKNHSPLVGNGNIKASSRVLPSAVASNSSVKAGKIISPYVQRRDPPPSKSRWLCCLPFVYSGSPKLRPSHGRVVSR
eukprot:TRINITY_DN3318_c0_g1_i1.p1 TRINITY_DN3318_c0_g1~~TRINITY_DN3318_c0_g1_i1.p1  ORF type:complete len:476 (-),score=46.42 TRINITY_DN3318_c0_g1_i1:287-1564(-)